MTTREHIHDKLEGVLRSFPPLVCRSDTHNSSDGQSVRGAAMWAVDAHFSGARLLQESRRELADCWLTAG